MSHASRNASAPAPSRRPPSRICLACGNEYEGARPSSYCGDSCRQRAFRARRQRPVVPLTTPRRHSLDVLYECVTCGDRLLNAQRCESCNRFGRRLGLAVTCSSCDEPILLSELLEQLGLEVPGPR